MVARTTMVLGVASVTQSAHSWPSQCVLPASVSRSRSRSAGAGVVWSRCSRTTADSPGSLRVQFSKGLLTKYETGTISRR